MRIFLSHKHKDSLVALFIQEELQRLAPEKLTVFLSENIPLSDDWFDHIKSELHEADRLLFLYTSTSETWDWCLYEVGVFTAMGEDRSVYYVYPEGAEPPDPLKRWQGFSSTPEGWKSFLQQLFGDTGLDGEAPLNPEFAADEAQATRLANRIAERIGSNPRTWYYRHSLDLVVTSKQLESLSREGVVPEDAEIFAEDPVLEVFGLEAPSPEKPWRWADLKQALERTDQLRWVDSLNLALEHAATLKSFDPTLPILVSAAAGRTAFQPMVDLRRLLTGNRAQFRITFAKSTTPTDVFGESRLARLAAVMLALFRYRWRLIERYVDNLAVLERGESDDARERAELDEVVRELLRIESMSAYMKLLEREVLEETLPDGIAGQPAWDFFLSWEDVKDRVRKAAQEDSVSETLAALDELKQLNGVALGACTMQLGAYLHPSEADAASPSFEVQIPRA